jgi:hypothetical protein
VIIPPSIPMILYGVSAEVSIGELFIAGFGPGLLIGGALIAVLLGLVQVQGLGQERRRRPPAFRPRARAGRLGAADAGDHPGRHLRRHLHADRGVRGGGVLRAGGRHGHVPRDQACATCT